MSDVLLEERATFRVDAFGCAFTVYGDPAPGGSKRAFRAKNSDRIIITEDSKRSKPWRQQVAEVALALMEGREVYAGALKLTIAFYVQRPRSHYGKRGVNPSAPRYPAVRPDLTKLVRPLEDALKGIVWRDDQQVVVQQISKHYGEPARAEVEVRILL